MPTLNSDALFLIFEKLQDDLNTLLAYCLVNRLWCVTAIPILWRNPWRYHKIDNNQNLFLTIASCLSNNAKKFITNQDFKLTREPPLFDYLSYGRCINVKIIDSIISIGSSLPFNQYMLRQEFHKLLINKCSLLHHLDINAEHQALYFSESKLRMKLLTELVCDTIIDSSHFCGLAIFCKRIQKIKIINKCVNSNHGIVELIEAQKNLRYFEWKDEFNEDEFKEDPYKKVFSMLAKENNVLNHLKVFFLYVYPYNYLPFKSVLHKFLHLRSLIIISADLLITNEQSNKLIYPNLETLNIDYIKLNVASSIIENSGGHIVKILLNNVDFIDREVNFSKDSLTFIRTVHKYCPLIKYLSLALSPSDEHFIELRQLLRDCQNL
jgi:hypothetical protein